MSDNPLLNALPPASDYLTYLTILEYNLTREQLPTLHQLLQDQELTSNIGWDLVHLLLPLLPAAGQCLQDVARLGNPREVVLKVTESLRGLDIDNDERASDDGTLDTGDASEDNEIRSGGLDGQESGERDEQGTKEAPSESHSRGVQMSQTVRQFITLVSMLSTLQPRIKTKYPSRFLSTSLRAVLKAYTQLAWSQEATASVLQLVRDLSGQKRPSLPPRMSSKEVRTASSQPSAPDPEAQQDLPTSEERGMQVRLLQSFLTHVFEDYMSCLSSADDAVGLSWTSRLQEKTHPDKVVPNRKTYAQRFAEVEDLYGRDAIAGQVLALARDLALDLPELLLTVTQPESTFEPVNDDDTLPSSASDIPLSRIGALYLFVARIASGKLFNSSPFVPNVSVFPEHAQIIQTYLGSETMATIGTEAVPLIDAILFLGMLAIDTGQIGQPEDDERFNEYLQRLSLLSANTPSPSLRYHAHVLTSAILHSHPSDLVRLTFIQDTLEHCPYENLKASAVGWLKDEVLAASNSKRKGTARELSVFATVVAIDSTAEYIFPDLTQTFQPQATADSWTTFKLNFSFYLASLNFYYLLLSSQHIREALDVASLDSKHHISQRFLSPLRELAERYYAEQESSDAAEINGQSNLLEGLIDIEILNDALKRVSDAIVAFNLQ